MPFLPSLADWFNRTGEPEHPWHFAGPTQFGEPSEDDHASKRGWMPFVDILEEDGQFVIRVPAATHEVSQIDVQLKPDKVLLRLHDYQRIVSLPSQVATQDVGYNYRNNALEITVQKSEDALTALLDYNIG